MNIQTKAIYVLAAAVVAHPFITQALQPSTYSSKEEAIDACHERAARYEDKVLLYRPQPWQKEEKGRQYGCHQFSNHIGLGRADDSKTYQYSRDVRINQKQDIVARFYF